VGNAHKENSALGKMGYPDETLELTFSGAKLTCTQFDAAGKPIGHIMGEC
jgi:hypothetical protein